MNPKLLQALGKLAGGVTTLTPEQVRWIAPYLKVIHPDFVASHGDDTTILYKLGREDGALVTLTAYSRLGELLSVTAVVMLATPQDAVWGIASKRYRAALGECGFDRFQRDEAHRTVLQRWGLASSRDASSRTLHRITDWLEEFTPAARAKTLAAMVESTTQQAIFEEGR